MLHRIFVIPFLLMLAMAAQAASTEPLLGTWKLTSQTMDGRKVDSEDMTLRIYPMGDAFEFAYSTPINGIYLVSLKFTSVHLDGSEGSVQDVRGKKIGTVKITKVSPLEYRAVIEGQNRPKASTKMTISSDDKTLSSESTASGSAGDAPRAVQVFSRR